MRPALRTAVRPFTRVVLRAAAAVALISVVALFVAATAPAAQTSAPLTGSDFQGGDGDQNRPAVGRDWQDLALSAQLTHDDNGSDTELSGKETEPDGWTYRVSTDGVDPGKSNILAAWSQPDARSDLFLYLAFIRQAVTGNTYLTFELNKATTSWVNSAGATIPCRSTGDLLLSYEVVPGGNADPVLVRMYRWTGTSGPLECPEGRIGSLSEVPLAGFAQGWMNFGGSITNYLSPGTYGNSFAAGSFGEAAINLDRTLGASSSPCFDYGRITMHSRSSDALTSALQDTTNSTPLTVRNCGISVTVSGPTALPHGAAAAYSYVVTNTGNQPLTNIGNVDDQCTAMSAPTKPVGDSDAILQPGEVWNYTCTTTMPASHTAGETNPIVHTATASGTRVTPTASATVTGTATHSTRIIHPQISVDKSGPATAVPGQSVTYSFVVTNAGETPLASIQVSDDKCATFSPTITKAAGDNGDAILDLTERWTYTCTYTLAAATSGAVKNTATATGTSNGASYTDTDEHTTNVLLPAINVAKSGPTTAVPGQAVTYSFVVTNAGDAPLASIQVSDDKCSSFSTTITKAAGDNGDAILDLTESWTYTCTYTIAAATSGAVKNTATATGTTHGTTYTDTAEHTTTVLRPAIDVAKSGPATAVPGQVVTYSFVVTNAGDVPLGSIQVSDDTCAPVSTTITKAAGDNGDAILDLTESWTYTCTYTIAAATSGAVKNTATATGTTHGTTYTDTAEHTTTVLRPAINVAKSGPATAVPGQAVTYSFVVTNAGNAPLGSIEVSDDTCAPVSTTITKAAGDNRDAILDLTETWTYTCTYTVNSATSGNVKNTVTATGTSHGTTYTDTAEHTTNVLRPAINVAKGGPATAVPGQAVTYSFVVTNAGNAPLGSIEVSDDTCAPVSTTITKAAGDNGDAILDLTETWTYTCTYTVNSATSGNVKNTATAIGTTHGTSYTDTDQHTTNVLRPAINVVKDGPATAVPGQSVTYSFVVTNAGNAPLGSITVSDDTCAPISTTIVKSGGNDDTTLDLTEAWTYTCTYSLGANASGVVENTVTASGSSHGTNYTATDQHTTTVLRPAIDVAKSGPATAVPGEAVTYTFVVTNAGTAPLDSITVTDDQCASANFSATIVKAGGNTNSTLDVGESWTYTCTYLLTAGASGQIENVANATGTSDGGLDYTDSDKHTTTVLTPAIDVAKSGPATAVPGEAVTYTFVVTNAGTAPLGSISVEDDTCSAANFSATVTKSGGNQDAILDTTESWTYTCTYSLAATTSSDVTNIAIASGTSVGGLTYRDQDTHTTGVLLPAITVEKSGPTTAVPGQSVTYTFAVENTGFAPLTDVTVGDDKCIAANFSATIAKAGGNTNSTLDVGETWTYTCTYELAASTKVDVTNTATATGTSAGDIDYTDTDTHTTGVLLPAITVEKSGPTTAVPGQSVTYTFAVENTGFAPLTDVTVGDDKCIAANFSATIAKAGGNTDSTLDVGETWTYTCTYQLAASTKLDVTNTATATGTSAGDIDYTDTDTHTTGVLLPAITVDKGGPTTAVPGQSVTYSFAVENTGFAPLTDVTVGDDKCIAANFSATIVKAGGNTDTTLDVGETWTYTCTYALAADAAGDIDNTVTASGTSAGGIDYTDTDEHTTTVLLPAIDVAKSGPATAVPGQTVTYTFVVTNAGDAPLSSVQVSDDTCATFSTTVTKAAGDDGDAVLDLGETWTYTCSYVVDAATSGDVVNTATATGETHGFTYTDTDKHTTTVLRPTIAVTKGGPATAVPGQDVTYTFLVANAGNAPLASIQVSDDTCAPVSTTITKAAGDNGDAILDLTETWTYTCTYTVGAATKGDVTNTVTASGTSHGTTYTATDEHTTTVLTPGIEVAKSGPATAVPGQAVTYTFVVTNAGNAPLSSVQVSDDTCPSVSTTISKAAGDNGDAVLDATETWTYTCTYTVAAATSGDVTNTATASGASHGTTYTDTDQHTTTVLRPAIEVAKSGPATAVPGQSVTYTFVVTNDGDAPLASIRVSDDTCAPVSTTITKAAGDNGDSTLDLTETWTYTCTYTVGAATKGDVTNTVTATGTSHGTTYTATDEHTTNVLTPGIEVTKSGPTTAVAGQAVTYTFVVTNAGNAPLGSIQVSDDTCAPVSATITKAAGDNGDSILDLTESWTYTCTYVVGAATSGDVVNTATATGTTHGTTYTGTDEHTTNVLVPAVDVAKSGPATAVPGQEVTYTFVVTNAGDAPLASIRVSDDRCASFSATITKADGDNGDAILDLTETWTYTCTYTIDSATSGDVVNTATASGTSHGTTYTDTDEHTTTVLLPAIEVAKYGPANARAGQTVTYTFVVSNTGNAPLDTIQVSDDKCATFSATIARGAGDDGDAILDPTEQWTYTCSYVMGADVSGDLTNTATATGSSHGQSYTDTDTHTTFVLVTLITMNKTVFNAETQQWEATNRAHVGDTIRYTITVANAGNNTLDFDLVDAECARTWLDESVDAGDTTTFTCEHVVTAADGDTYVNVATIDGTDAGGDPVDGRASASTSILKPDFTVTKQVRVAGSGAAFAPSTSARVGATLEYQIVVTNTGNTPLTFDLADPGCGAIASTAPAGHDGIDDVIARGAAVTYSCTHVVAPLDPNPYVNVVRAVGTDGLGLAAAKDARADASIVVPGLVVDKQVRNATAGRDFADSGRGVVGDTLEFRHTLTNAGNVPLTVSVTDDKCTGLVGPAGFDGAADVLAPAQTVQYTCSHVLTATDPNPFVNVVLVNGVDPLGGTTTATDTASVQVDPVPVAAGGPAPRPTASSRMTPPSGCQRGRFPVLVTGTNIRFVQVYVDGRLRATIRKARGNRWMVRLTTRGLRPGATHRISVRVTYRPATKRRPAVHAARLAVCRPVAVLPAFTG